MTSSFPGAGPPVVAGTSRAYERWHGTAPAVGTAVRVLCLGLTVVLTQTILWSESAPAVLKMTIVGVALLSAIRPDQGLLVVAGLAPFGRIIGSELFDAYPTHFTEGLALAGLSGWLFASLGRDRRPTAPALPLTLAVLLGAVIVASLFVELTVLRHWKDYWAPFAAQLGAYLSRDYLGVNVSAWPRPTGLDGATVVGSALLMLEGLGLAFAVRETGTKYPSFPRHLARVLALAAAATAALSVTAAAAEALASGRQLSTMFSGPRLAAHTPKVNTAASSFVLFIPIVVGFLLEARRASPRRWSNVLGLSGRAAMALGAGVLLVALWITGSRSGLFAILIVAVCAAAVSVVGSIRRRARIREILVPLTMCVAVGLIVGVGIYQKAWSAPTQTSMTMAAVRIRELGLVTSVRMLQTSPVFGIGIGQYYQASRTFTPEATSFAMERPFNAHNQFLQVAAELGLAGVALFTGFIAVVCYRAWVAFRLSRDRLLGGVLAGLAAFLITSLAGQPLLVEIVAYPFWLALGTALAYGDQPSPVPVPDAGSHRPRILVTAGLIVALAASVPIRAKAAVDGVDYSAVSYGLSAPGTGRDGLAYRLANGRATFFLQSNVRRLELPIRLHQLWRRPVTVELLLDGKPAARLSLSRDRWEVMRAVIAPDAARRYHRVDLRILAPVGAEPLARVGDARTYQTLR